MADDALPPIASPPIEGEIDPLLGHLHGSKAALARFLGVSRQAVSRWASGRGEASERNKAAIRFLGVALVEEDPRLPMDFGEWALGMGIRGLVAARLGMGQAPEPSKDETPNPEGLRGKGPVLGPGEIREIRQKLGWIQAEMAAFFGVTHSTPAKWEKIDPRVGPAGEAALLALREQAGASDTYPVSPRGRPTGEQRPIRDLWQVGINYYMTDILGWEDGIYPGR